MQTLLTEWKTTISLISCRETLADITLMGRQLCKELVMHPECRAQSAGLIQEWWADIALPCLYDGAVAGLWKDARDVDSRTI